ncbi:uncharacterized protein LOC144433379 [Glandiceps talaboti]
MNTEHKPFFSNLRQIAVNAEKQSVALKDVLQKPPPSGEDSVVSSELMLREMLKETKDVKSEAKVKMHRVKKEHSSFNQLLSAHKALYQSNLDKYQQLETFLQKYGYQSANKNENEASSSCEIAQVLVTEDNKENIDCCQQQSTHNEDNTLYVTPVKEQIEENAKSKNTAGTPKLENFGLSRTTLEMLARLGSTNSETSTTDCDTCDDDMTYCIETSTSHRYVTPAKEQLGEPAKSKNIAGTPKLENFGLSRTTLEMLARLDSTKSETSAKDMYSDDVTYSIPTSTRPRTTEDGVKHNVKNSDTPEPWKGHSTSGFITPKQPKPARYGNLVEPSVDSPVPPVFMTPGIIQIKKPTTVHQKALSSQETSTQYDIDSPIPPVFVTPGIKQIKKQPTNQKQPSQTQGRSDSFGVDSPVPPVFMTPGVMQIGKLKTNQEPRSFLSQDKPTTMMSPAIPRLQSECDISYHPLGQTSTHTPSPVTLVSKALHPEDMPTPEPPEMTSRIQPLPQQPILRSATADIVDKEMPKTPVLNFTYSYQDNTDSQPIETPLSSYNQPITAVHTKEQQQSMVRIRVILPVSSEELLELSDNLQRIVALEKLNEIIMKTNEVLEQNGSGGAFIRKSELPTLQLGRHTYAVLLLLVKLNRLQMERKNQCGEIVHYIC